jgi:ribonuclease P protein component
MNSIIKIKENHIFRRAYRRGTSLVCPYAVVYVLKNPRNNIRLGITSSKKIGNAVCRNRARRVITAAFRSVLPQIGVGCDFVIVARSRILTAKSTQVADALLKLFAKAELINSANVNQNEQDID